MIKGLCSDVKTAARFTAYLAELAQERKEFAPQTTRFSAAEKRRQKALATEALAQIESYLKRRTQSRSDKLYELLWEAREINNVYRNIPYGVVREVQNRRALLIEKALQCTLAADNSAASFWAYQVARDYTEKYDPSHGTGLIPASVPMLEEILDFWSLHYFGQSAAAWYAAQPTKKRR